MRTTDRVVVVQQRHGIDCGGNGMYDLRLSPVLQHHSVRGLGHGTEIRMLKGGYTSIGRKRVQQDDLKVGLDVR